MEDSKSAIENKVELVSLTLLVVDVVVMVVFTGMSVLVSEFSRTCKEIVGSPPLALSFLGSIVPGKYLVFVSIVAVALVLKEYYIPNKWVRLILNVLVAYCAVMYFLLCVFTIVVTIRPLFSGL